MAARIAVIDGTGADDDGQYRKDMEQSFCRVLANQLGPAADYQRGPSMAGMEVRNEALRAAGWLRRQRRLDATADLMLAGYSRGGSAAIWAAEMLEREGVPVHSLFLFDPVARHLYDGGEVIPSNVRFSRVCRRAQNWAFVMKYEGTLSSGKRLGATSNPVRPFFGNTGLQWRGMGDHEAPTVFTGSHGALGGVGWAFVSEDSTCQAQVSAWMGGHMKARGLDVKLGPGSLDPTPPTHAGRATKLAGQALDATLIGRSAVERLMGGWSGF